MGKRKKRRIWLQTKAQRAEALRRKIALELAIDEFQRSGRSVVGEVEDSLRTIFTLPGRFR